VARTLATYQPASAIVCDVRANGIASNAAAGGYVNGPAPSEFLPVVWIGCCAIISCAASTYVFNQSAAAGFLKDIGSIATAKTSAMRAIQYFWLGAAEGAGVAGGSVGMPCGRLAARGAGGQCWSDGRRRSL
jgi:hypothetical protein